VIVEHERHTFIHLKHSETLSTLHKTDSFMISAFRSTKMNLTRCQKYNQLWKTHIHWLINWILQTGWTISIWNYSILQRQSHFQTTYTKEV